MMRFRYKAKQGLHQYQSGVIDAASYQEAVERLMRKGLTPIDVCAVTDNPPGRPGSRPSGFLYFFQSLGDRVFQHDVVDLTRYLADFLNSGLPLLRALQLTRRYFKTGRMHDALEKIEGAVRDGDPLSRSLEAFPAIFSGMYVNMIRAGEMSGSLDEMAARLADFLEHDRENRLKVASSMIYPAVIVAVAVVTIFILLVWVIPLFIGILTEMNQTLPWMTRVLMGTSNVFVKYWWMFFGVLILGSLLFLRWHHTAEGRLKCHQAMLAFPVVGVLLRELSVARFTRTLGTLLDGGIEILPALTYAAKVVENSHLRNQLMNIADAVSSGTPFTSAAAESSDTFSEADISVLSVGEETGALSSGLFRLAVFYEKSSDRRIKTMTTLLEPGLILGLALVIGCVVLALLMPILQINFMVR